MYLIAALPETLGILGVAPLNDQHVEIAGVACILCRKLHRHESLSAYVAYYNEERLHWSLDIDRCETPLEAFGKRRATDAIRKGDPEWAERDTND